MHKGPNGWRGTLYSLALASLLLTAAACGRQPLPCLAAQPASPPPGLPFLADGSAIIPDPDTMKALNQFVKERAYGGWCRDEFRGLGIRQTGPILPVAGRSDTAIGLTTHAQVRVFYSPEVARWLDDDRQGPIPDGAMMVKEMYGIPLRKREGEPVVEGWAVMVRDSSASRDGWLWYLYYPPGNQPYWPFRFESGQNGLSFCLACHASAESEATFAFRGNLVNDDVATFVTLGDVEPGKPPEPDDVSVARAGAHGGFADLSGQAAGLATEIDDFRLLLYRPVEPPRKQSNPAFLELFGETIDIQTTMSTEPRALPMDAAFDHVPVPGMDERPPFVTADNCAGCHDSSDLLNGTYPEMTVRTDGRQFPLGTSEFANLSPYGEWSGSLMSVSSRDPVFRAQLEWETLAYPDHAQETTRFCLSCHGAMGQRSHPALAGDLTLTYAVPAGYDDLAYTPDEAEFGALARDGVSCAVCHRMAAEGLGEPETFNAQFHTDPPDQLNGPYEDVKTRPMVNALGITPQFAGHISDSGLCGSCHMVETPVLDHPGPDHRAHEQTTYLEWRNSEFGRSGDPDLTCQGCHMPDINPMDPAGAPVKARIANVEDTTFPYAPHRLSSEALDLEPREGYRRHTLTGINLFTQRFFAQFPLILGANTFYPVRPSGALLSPQAMVMSEATTLARHHTVRLSLEPGSDKRFVVKVENLVGHKFPTGVGFRRAWLEVSARAADGRVAWCSGCADGAGSLLDGPGGELLTSERPAQSNRFEPDRSVINRQSQVQIYETRHTNYAGRLTTSFLELNDEVKDNRLLPRGWDPAGFPKFELNPVPLPEGAMSHVDEVVYDLGDVAGEVSVCARLYYQALPPYYLIDRAQPLAGHEPAQVPESHRLVHLTTRLNEGKETGNSAIATIAGWKLRVAEAGVCAQPVSVARTAR